MQSLTPSINSVILIGKCQTIVITKEYLALILQSGSLHFLQSPTGCGYIFVAASSSGKHENARNIYTP